MTTRSDPAWLSYLGRFVDGVLPAADGGAPAALKNMGTRLRWLVLSFVGFATGGVVGLLLFLAWQAVPDVPLLLVGLFVGVLLGFSAALAVAVRVLSARKKGGWALVFLPLTLLAAPLLLLGAGYDAIKTRRRHRATK